MFSSIRGLNCQQTRFQDDIESLIYLACFFVTGSLPWDVDFKRMKKPDNLNLNDQINAYKNLRLQNHESYVNKVNLAFNEVLADLPHPHN